MPSCQNEIQFNLEIQLLPLAIGFGLLVSAHLVAKVLYNKFFSPAHVLPRSAN